MTAAWPVIFALTLWACAEQPTQALVTVRLAPEVEGRVAWIEARRADEGWRPTERVLRFGLVGPDAEALPLSFGVAPDEDGHIRVLVRAYESVSSTRPILEQTVEVTALDQHEKRRVPLVLGCMNGATCSFGCSWDRDPTCKTAPKLGASCGGDQDCVGAGGICHDSVCCTQRCVGACVSCAVPGFEGQCTASEPPLSENHCGGCELACSNFHVPFPHCSRGPGSQTTSGEKAVCDGVCEQGWDTCSNDTTRKRKTGCDIDLNNDADHCGDCTTRCPFGVCVRGTCESSTTMGNSAGDEEVLWPADRMFGVIYFAPEKLMLAGLGIRVRLGEDTRLRVGLYSANTDQSPGQLEAAGGEVSSDPNRWTELGVDGKRGGLEIPLATPFVLEAKTYHYLFFIASKPVVLMSQDRPAVWYASAEGALTYAGVRETLPTYAGGNYPLVDYEMRPLAALYGVLVPETNR